MAIQHIGNTGYIGTGANAITVGVPTGYQQNDLLLLILQGYDAYPAAPAGWTSIVTQTNTNTFLRVCYKIAAASESSVEVADSGNSTRGIMITFRGVDNTNPIHAISKATSAGTSYSGAGLTTTINACMIVNCVGFRDADANDTDNYTSWANASLASVTEGWDEGTNAGTGGGLAYAYGIDTTAGTVNAFTAMADLGANYSATITIALKDINESGVDNRNGTVAITNSNSITVTGKAISKSGSVAISNSNSISATIKKDGKSTDILVFDSFNRANASTLGNTDTGQTWEHYDGTWGIIDNKAYLAGSAGWSSVLLDILSLPENPDMYEISFDLNYESDAWGAIQFMSDGNTLDQNRYVFVFGTYDSPDHIRISRKVSGSDVALGQQDLSSWLVDGNAYKIRVRVNMNTMLIQCFVDDTLFYEFTDSMLFSKTHFGLGGYHGSVGQNRYDNFTLKIIQEDTLNSISVTGVKDAVVNKNGTVAISNSFSNSVIGKKITTGTVAIENSSSNSVTGKAVNRNGSVEIANINSVSATGQKGAKSIVAIGHNDSNSIIGKAVNRNGIVEISHSNVVLATVKKSAKLNVSASNGSSNLAIGKKGAASTADIQHSGLIIVTGEKASENISGGVVSIVNYHSTAATGLKSSRAPPISISGTASVNVIGKKNTNGILSIGSSNSVSAVGNKSAKASVDIYGASSNSAAGRKAAKGTAVTYNEQAILVTGNKITAGMGTVSITSESSLIAKGQKVAKKTVVISHANSVSADGRKGGKVSVIITEQIGGSIGATKFSFAEISLSNHTALLVVGIRSSVQKPYEVLLELVERRLDIDLGVTEGGVEISLHERIAILEVEEWLL